MTNAHETQCKVKTLKTDTEEINQWKKIKTQSINVREQHSKYKVYVGRNRTVSARHVHVVMLQVVSL